METTILNGDLDDGERIILNGRDKEGTGEDAEKQKWKKLIGDHKRWVFIFLHGLTG
jgi:hypothetical protein